jgi:hypothetical protein
MYGFDCQPWAEHPTLDCCNAELLINLLSVSLQNFQSLFCERLGCSPSEYEERAFKACLYWHAKLLAPLLGRATPDLFAEDFKFIQYLGEATGLREANACALDFQDAKIARPNFRRRRLKIPESSRKIVEAPSPLTRAQTGLLRVLQGKRLTPPAYCSLGPSKEALDIHRKDSQGVFGCSQWN